MGFKVPFFIRDLRDDCVVSGRHQIGIHKARGGRKKDFRENSRDSEGWFLEVPGLLNQIGLLAWKHRQKAPLIYVSTPRSNGDGSGIRIETILHSVWAEGSRFVVAVPDSYPELLRSMFDAPWFSPNEHACLYLRLIIRAVGRTMQYWA